MHRGWGRDNSAAEERAQRKGIKINRYSAGGPQFCSPSWPDPGSHEPDAGQCQNTFKKQTGEIRNAAYFLLGYDKNKFHLETYCGNVLCLFSLCNSYLIPDGEFCQIQGWKWECEWVSHTQRPCQTLVRGIGFPWELFLEKLLQSWLFPFSMIYLHVVFFPVLFAIWLWITFTYFLLKNKSNEETTEI